MKSQLILILLLFSNYAFAKTWKVKTISPDLEERIYVWEKDAIYKNGDINCTAFEKPNQSKSETGEFKAILCMVNGVAVGKEAVCMLQSLNVDYLLNAIGKAEPLVILNKNKAYRFFLYCED